MKIEEIIKKTFEHVRDWEDNPFVKLSDLYSLYKAIDDANLKLEICRELLEEIDPIIDEFSPNTKMTSKILDMKNDMKDYMSVIKNKK